MTSRPSTTASRLTITLRREARVDAGSRSRPRLFSAGLLLLAKAPLLYAAVYVANVQSSFVSVSKGPLYRSAAYRIGGRVAEELFITANQIDRLVRPWLWVSHDPTDPSR
jgi:hypothetical protein